MQVDPIKSTLELPGTKRLKLTHDALLSSFALKFNLDRYSEALLDLPAPGRGGIEYKHSSDSKSPPLPPAGLLRTNTRSHVEPPPPPPPPPLGLLGTSTRPTLDLRILLLHLLLLRGH